MKHHIVIFVAVVLLNAIAFASEKPQSGIADSGRGEKGSAEWYQYSPAIVTLVGTLDTESAFGPPGYGESPESDKVEKYYVLKLSKPINVMGQSDTSWNADTVIGISKLQLSLKYGMNFMRFVSKKVVVKGCLLEQVLAFYRTKVFIDVIDVRRYAPSLKRRS